MIVATQRQEIEETAPVVQFKSAPPSHNPFVPSTRFALRREHGGIVLDWPQAPEPSAADVVNELAADMVARSEHEVRKYANSSRARTNLAIAFAITGKTERAIATFREALQLDPGNYVAASNLGKVLIDQNRLDEAEIIYVQLRRDFPHLVTPLISLAVLAMRRGDFTKAERLLREGESFGVSSATLNYHLALVLLHRGETRNAIKHLKLALQVDVRSPALYQALGIAYAISGNNEKSSRAFQTALNLAPNFGDAVTGLGNTLLRIGQADGAIAALVDYVESSPDDSAAHLVLARAYLAKKRYTAARAQFSHVYKAVRETTEANRQEKSKLANDIGFCYYREHEVRAAERWFRTAIQHSVELGPLPYRNLGVLYLHSDNADAALPVLRKAKIFSLPMKSFPCFSAIPGRP